MQKSKPLDNKVMIKEALILFLITLVSGLMLGFVYELTKDPIAKQREAAVNEACKEVFESAENFENSNITVSEALQDTLKESGVTIGSVYLAKNSGGTLLGYVIETVTTAGYGGTIDLYVGISNEGKVLGVSILEIHETPALGMRAEEVLVPQYKDKEAQIFIYTKSGSTSESEIDAISGATITTKAFVNAVNGAVMASQEWTTVKEGE